QGQAPALSSPGGARAMPQALPSLDQLGHRRGALPHMACGNAGSPGSGARGRDARCQWAGLGEAVDDLTAIAPDRCAALVAPQIERLTFAVIHASIKRAGPRVVTYGVPLEAIDIVGQLRTGLAARPVSAAGLASVYRYRDP